MSDYQKFYEVAVRAYRELHQYPELDFELEKTVTVVKRVLGDFGIEYTEKYGKGSVVAEIGNGQKVLAFRADMDALPIEEKSDLNFSSKIKGRMHACGHDSHTAILLAVAGYLKGRESQLNCKVRFIFQPSEEGIESGAKMMLDNGVMEGVSQILATHCEPQMKAGEIGVCVGNYMAACMSIKITFFGKSAHATIPEEGIDAIAMANEAYLKIKEAVKKEAGNTRYIWSAGRFHGGQVNNVICDECYIGATFRFYDYEFALRVEEIIKDVCNAIAKEYGGKVDIDCKISTGAVVNDSKMVDYICEIAQKLGVSVNQHSSKMTSEDFGWYVKEKPGVLFRYGTYNEEMNNKEVLHNCGFKIYEPAMQTAIKIFAEYALNF